MKNIQLPGRKLQPAQMEAFGFLDMGGESVYFGMLGAGKYRLELHVSPAGDILAGVFDRATDEEIDIDALSGMDSSMAEKLRADYEVILHAFSNHCSDPV